MNLSVLQLSTKTISSRPDGGGESNESFRCDTDLNTQNTYSHTDLNTPPATLI